MGVIEQRAATIKRVQRKFANRWYRFVHGHRFAPPLPEHEAEISAEPGTIGPRQYSELHNRSHVEVYRLGTSLLSPDAREILARRATHGTLGWTSVLQVIVEPNRRLVPAHWELKPLLFAVFLNYFIDTSPRALEVAETVLRQSVRHQQIGSVSEVKRLWKMSLQTAALRGNAQLHADMLTVRPAKRADTAWATGVDLIRPSKCDEMPELHMREWWGALNRPYTDAGLEPWALDALLNDHRGNLFARIHAPQVTVASQSVDGPLVTIVVPCYNPDATLLAAIESACRQSWGNLEIILVDDASTEGMEFIQRSAASDPRVRLIRQSVNGGAYSARNAGMRAARGEFVTILDADDLSHSRRIERQMKPLLNRPELIATAAHSLGLSPDGKLTDFGSGHMIMNLSTLLIRKDAVLSTTGYYDQVRKAADREFIERIYAVHGEQSVRILPEPLGLIQLTLGSLSRGELRGGSDWISGPRLAYRQQLRGWHATLANDPSPLPISEHPKARPFRAPQRLLGLPERGHYARVFLGEWTSESTTTEAQLGTLKTSMHPDETYGLLRGVNLRESDEAIGSIRSDQHVWELVERNQIEWVSWSQVARVDELVVTDPECLVLLPDAGHISLEVASITVHAPGEAAHRPALDHAWIESQCRRAFGVHPEWA